MTNTPPVDYEHLDQLEAQARKDAKASILTAVAVALLLLGALFSQGCCGKGTIKAAEIDTTLRLVIKRHEAYTKNDETLTDLERRLNLRDGTALLEVLDAAKTKTEK